MLVISPGFAYGPENNEVILCYPGEKVVGYCNSCYKFSNNNNNMNGYSLDKTITMKLLKLGFLP